MKTKKGEWIQKIDRKTPEDLDTDRGTELGINDGGFHSLEWEI